jgi:glycosyltransferase involved in cell wall biosynthesis
MVNISIILPCYNRIDQTIQTISLLLNSNGLNKEFSLEIIVSDSSPDNKLEIAVKEKFADKIKYLKPEKQGIAANKNAGAKVASHPILIFCDSDMEVESDTIINTINSLNTNKKVAGMGGQVVWKNGEKNGKLDRPRKEDRMLTVDGVTYIEALYSRYFATYKKVFFDVGGYDEQVFNMRGEGSDLSIRYWRAGYPLAYDEKIIVHHVFDTEGGIIRGVPHPEWGIAKDLLLLSYKYDLSSDDKNFINSVKSNFEKFPEDGYFQIIEGIKNNLQFIIDKKPIIDEQKKNMKAKYDFKFLEIFSNKELFNECIDGAQQLLKNFKD